MKFHFYTLFMTLFSFTMNAQTLPVHKYKNKLTSKSVKYQQSQYHSILQIDFGFHLTSFQNARFFEIANQKILDPQLGYQFKVNIVLKPFTIYGQFFSSNFDASAYPGWRFPNDTRITHSGLVFGLNMQMLPFTKIAKYINPTLGIAYRYADVCANCSDTENKEIHIIKPASELVWTFGTQIHFSRFFYLAGEYNQSVMKSDFRNSTISISLGYKYNK
ncbi:MAG: hypothetical protein R2774_09385 [Saprospiraceae bacterium]